MSTSVTFTMLRPPPNDTASGGYAAETGSAVRACALISMTPVTPAAVSAPSAMRQ